MNILKMILVMAIAIFSFSGADAQIKEEESKIKKDTATTNYQCPMKCEGEKTYHKNGKCPICNMQLKAVEAPEALAAAFQCPMKCESDKTYVTAGKCPICEMDLKRIATVGNAKQVKKTAEVSYNPNALGDSSKRSIKSAAVGNIGEANVTISYHSPGVRKRLIWGGLVPYDEVWVTGAHNATTIEIDKSFIVDGKTIPAGKYALFTIPGKSLWTVIINKNWNQHLTDDYLENEDVVRIMVKPVKQTKITERLQYYIENGVGDNGRIAIVWEELKIEFPLAIKN